ncbi:DUF2169 domain-containing protein [Teredinibacter turnerae]|uniref:DUF2169 family type VI secretion system accessory protein n=1 Tax=Teredinibacter turnerae TaxID=2426 RepID=UPI00036D0B18|nr:DUF2169 domain-containing protein [Teredinibacter turnerae]
MFALLNRTPFSAAHTIYPNAEGVDTLQIIVRARFELVGTLTLTEQQPEPIDKDVYWGEPDASSLKISSDYLLPKTATDILINGNAVAPEGIETRDMKVSFRIGALNHEMKVVGDRFWEAGEITSAAPFVTMPLRYENSFGGLCSGAVPEERFASNPVGKGYFRGKRPPDGLALPNIERVGSEITEHQHKPVPAGCGGIAPGWEPRAALAGTFDESWQRERAPFLPLDYDNRFANAATPDLRYPGFITGGEPIELSGLTAAGVIATQVPLVKLSAVVELAAGREILPFNCETLHIETDECRFSMVWKAVYVAPRCQEKIRSAEVKMVK